MLSSKNNNPDSKSTQKNLVTVKISVRDFFNIIGDNYLDGEITAYQSNESGLILNSKKTAKRLELGQYILEWPIETTINVRFTNPNYQTTQSATIIVPKEGFNSKNPQKNIAMQVPSKRICWLFSKTMNIPLLPDGRAQAIAAAAAWSPEVTLDYLPQGFLGGQIKFEPTMKSSSHQNHTWYFDVFRWNIFPLNFLIYKTFLWSNRVSTSPDSGALLSLDKESLPESGKCYKVTVTGPANVPFTTAAGIVCPGVLTNIAPPQSTIPKSIIHPALIFPYGPALKEKQRPRIALKSILTGLLFGTLIYAKTRQAKSALLTLWFIADLAYRFLGRHDCDTQRKLILDSSLDTRWDLLVRLIPACITYARTRNISLTILLGTLAGQGVQLILNRNHEENLMKKFGLFGHANLSIPEKNFNNLCITELSTSRT